MVSILVNDEVKKLVFIFIMVAAAIELAPFVSATLYTLFIILTETCTLVLLFRERQISQRGYTTCSKSHK